MRKELMTIAFVLLFCMGVACAALVVPNEIQQPGTQPREVSNLETPDKCDNCHGLYDPAVEPAHNWRGSMMANAGRDPIFWATLAVAEQDFDGAGDLCIRCHSTAGWMAGRSVPTDGSALAAGDADGVECDLCHKMTNTDNSEHLGVMNSPFWANNNSDPGWMPGDPITGYYGSGMSSLWAGGAKLGPYIDAAARHQFLQSKFHRSVDFCGTCHDVSNPAVGDLAANNGKQDTADAVFANGILGGPITSKAAFNNLPFKYGVVERTFSEYKSGLLSKTLVSSYANLPADLKTGAVKAAYDSAIVAGTGGNYADGTLRYFSCQSCHMRPVTGQGCNKNPPIRKDLPLHDQTGGNYWMPDAIQYLDSLGKLRLGGGLTTIQVAAMNDGKTRAMKQLSQAANLSVNGNILKVVNTAGHKLISGYPEGRRMWLNIKWYDLNNVLLREDGKYGSLVDAGGNPVMVTNPATGTQVQVESILDLGGANTKIYEAHYAMTQEWVNQLLSLGKPGNLALSYDRFTGNVDCTLSQLASGTCSMTHPTYQETFHFVLNNKVAKDNRIPTYGMSYEEARKRNALPEPATQYGNPGPGGVYNYWDDVTLAPPTGAAYATIDLLYQPTSWEYIQFLYLANNRLNAFLVNEGAYMLEAWLAKGMAKPYIMASTTWGTAPQPIMNVSVDSLTTWSVNRQGNLVAMTSLFAKGDTVGIKAHTVDQNGANLSGSQVIMELRDARNTLLTTLQGFSGADGNAIMTWKSPKNTVLDVTATITNVMNDGYLYVPIVTNVTFNTR